ncbi:hypothetical protein O181_080493 [Austropuccinia psidii MF-1]|uniref:Uncharacterized protein n=1 Tax=Austropuccinia psidii MF-1 TaxID=1389203 RepID=A0A9Q3FMZ3_9BASI|nr:hypothetical protein [Austropuccinia psidii MF-1]
MRLQHCPHHSLHFCTPASSSPWLTILTLLPGPQVMPPTLLTVLTLMECLPEMPLTLLTILTLAVPSRHASDTTYHPYACSDLPTCLQCRLPSLRSYSACPICL